MHFNKNSLENSCFVLTKETEETKIKLALILSTYFPQKDAIPTDEGFNFIWVYDGTLWYSQIKYELWDCFKVLDHNEIIEKG